MKRLLLLTAVFLNSINSSAEAFLCITEAVAGVAQGDSIKTNATVYEPGKTFIVSDTGGKWTFKPFGDPSKTMQCSNSRYCGFHIGELHAVPTNIFFRNEHNKFNFVSQLSYDNEKGEYSEVYIYRGSCESI